MWPTWIRPLDAEAVSLGIAHHRPRLLQLPGLLCLRHDDLRAQADEPLDLRLAVRNVDVDVDRQLDRRRLRQSVEEQLGALAAAVHGRPAVAALLRVIGEDRRPESREAARIVGREGYVPQPKHQAPT